VQLDVDPTVCRRGRVLIVHGLASVVQTKPASNIAARLRRLLKSLSTEQRHVVAAGDRVWFSADEQSEGFS